MKSRIDIYIKQCTKIDKISGIPWKRDKSSLLTAGGAVSASLESIVESGAVESLGGISLTHIRLEDDSLMKALQFVINNISAISAAYGVNKNTFEDVNSIVSEMNQANVHDSSIPVCSSASRSSPSDIEGTESTESGYLHTMAPLQYAESESLGEYHGEYKKLSSQTFTSNPRRTKRLAQGKPFFSNP